MSINKEELMIIVEGSDCAGKSTLITNLAKHLNLPVIKGSSFEQSKCTNEELFKEFTLFSSADRVIFDRFIYSNEVYAPLYEDFSILIDGQRRVIETSIAHKAIIVYLEADLETLTSRLSSRGDDYVTSDKLQSIKDSYEIAIAKTTLPVLRYDTSDLSQFELLDYVLEDIKYELKC